MADFTFNIAKGRIVELYNRVKSNDPSTSALILVPLSLSGTEAQGQDFDTLALVLADAHFDEQTTGGWDRIVITDSELASLPAPDDTNNRYAVAVPEATWLVPPTGSDTTGLLVCYDSNTGSGDDTNIIPLTHHTFIAIADDNDKVLNAGDFFRAS